MSRLSKAVKHSQNADTLGHPCLSDAVKGYESVVVTPWLHADTIMLVMNRVRSDDL